MAVKFPREAFAAILNGNQVALNWLASLGGASTTVVTGAPTDLTAIEAEIATVAAAAASAEAAAEAAQESADEASMWTPTYNLDPREVQAAVTAAPPDLTGTTGIVSQTGPATYAAVTVAARLSFSAGTLDVVSSPKWTTARTLAITGDLAYTSPSLDGSGNVTAAGTLATVNSNVGTFGDATHVAAVTVNAKGLVTAVSSVAITGGGGSSSLVERKVLSGLSTYTVSSIPGTGLTLRVRIVGRSTQASTDTPVGVRVNGLTTSVYSLQRHFAEASSAFAQEFLTDTSWLTTASLAGANTTAGTVGYVELRLFDYVAASGLRRVGEYSGRQPSSTTISRAYAIRGALELNDTSTAITSVTVTLSSGTFATGSFLEVSIEG